MKLKKNIGRLQVGGVFITYTTDKEVIKRLLKNKPELNIYFEKDGKKSSKKD